MRILILTTHFIDFCTFLGFIAVTIYRFTAMWNNMMQCCWLGSQKKILVVDMKENFDFFQAKTSEEFKN